jgi:hypothetical protein
MMVASAHGSAQPDAVGMCGMVPASKMLDSFESAWPARTMHSARQK